MIVMKEPKEDQLKTIVTPYRNEYKIEKRFNGKSASVIIIKDAASHMIIIIDPNMEVRESDNTIHCKIIYANDNNHPDDLDSAFHECVGDLVCMGFNDTYFPIKKTPVGEGYVNISMNKRTELIEIIRRHVEDMDKYVTEVAF